MKVKCKKPASTTYALQQEAHFTFSASLSFADGSDLNFRAPDIKVKKGTVGTNQIITSLKENIGFLEQLLEKQMAMQSK